MSAQLNHLVFQRQLLEHHWHSYQGRLPPPIKGYGRERDDQLSERGDCVREESDGCVPVRLVLIQKGQSRAGAGRSTVSEKARQPTAPNASRPGEDGMAWHQTTEASDRGAAAACKKAGVTSR
ncbi:hypothetical protein B0T13DRAFT_109379 [Neurospora crassa]|nr:hypothetical protein B0T13DRAFT_109379 [Neurospora crassa]